MRVKSRSTLLKLANKLACICLICKVVLVDLLIVNFPSICSLKVKFRHNNNRERSRRAEAIHSMVLHIWDHMFVAWPTITLVLNTNVIVGSLHVNDGMQKLFGPYYDNSFSISNNNMWRWQSWRWGKTDRPIFQWYALDYQLKMNQNHWR